MVSVNTADNRHMHVLGYLLSSFSEDTGCLDCGSDPRDARRIDSQSQHHATYLAAVEAGRRALEEFM